MITRSVRTWRRLPLLQRRITLQAAMLLFGVKGSLPLLGFGRTRRCLGRWPVPLPHGEDIEPVRVVELTAAVANRLPFSSLCLVRSLVIERLFLSLGIPCELHFGTGFDEAGDFEAHAWVSFGEDEASSSLERWREFRPERGENFRSARETAGRKGTATTDTAE
ncbi:MAG: lasso peptide biosynthesis B2 protein [Verrucomicrobiota bacterium]